MFKIFLESFKRTNTSIILAIPLVIFILLAEIYYSSIKDLISDIPQMLLAIATIIFVLSAFMSSWFYMAKKTLKYSNKIFVFETDRGNAFKEILSSFHKGFGKLFLTFMGFILINIGIYYILHMLISFTIIKNVGIISFEGFNLQLLLNPLELHDKIINLSSGGELALSYWLCCMGICSSIISFITMLWIPEIVYSKNNVIASLFNSIKKIIISFPKSIMLYLYIQLLLLICAIISVICMNNIYLYFLAILFYYYLFIYIVVLLYTYYEQTFLK